jgi:hypothetical protein
MRVCAGSADLEATNEAARAGSSAGPAVTGSDLDDQLDPLSQGLRAGSCSKKGLGNASRLGPETQIACS